MGDNKRKAAAAAATGAGQQPRKKKTGNAGKWKTPHQQTKQSRVASGEGAILPGDTGVWVTCARHQEGKAAREVGVLFAEYAEKMYGIKSVHDTAGGEDSAEGGEEDIEAAIQREVAALTAKPAAAAAAAAGGDGGDGGNDNRMTPVKMNVDCLLFVKTQPPVEPVAFVRRICEDAKRCGEIPGLMRCRYVNRLTPVSVMGRATEQGLVEVAREALEGWFDLSGKRSAGAGTGTEVERTETEGTAETAETTGISAEVTAETTPATTEGEASSGSALESKAFTFAIRPTIRNHSNLKRDVVINTIAGLVNDDRHKVNLTAPDKVILVEIYQTVCGMSVVDGDWDELKRFNLTELYSQARTASGSQD